MGRSPGVADRGFAGWSLRGWFDFDDHEWRVLTPLVFAGFFEHYDNSLLSMGAPAIYRGLGVSEHTFAIAEAIIRVGSLGSILILRHADRVGRRRMLFVSIVAFTLLMGLTAASPALWFFVSVQFLGRAFLSAEGSLSNLVIAEEVRPDRRGNALSIFGILTQFGIGLVALLVPVVRHTPLGWRLYYIVVLIPLAFVVYLRRNLSETRAFELARDHERLQASFIPRLNREMWGRLWRCAMLFGASGVVAVPAFYYAASLAQNKWGWAGTYTLVILGAGPFGLAGYLLGGRGSDRWGRRPVLALSAVLGSVGLVLVFTEIRWLYAPGFYVLSVSATCAMALAGAYVAELFPTEVRATVFSFILAVNVAAGSIGLIGVAVLARWMSSSTTLQIGGVLLLGSLIALPGLPETKGADIVSVDPTRPAR